MVGGKRPLSVIVAGATGSTGSALVAKLVSHPRIDRVVALARFPIPVDRWASAFPGIRMADALRHLSVVEMDYERLQRDATQVRGVPMDQLATTSVDDFMADLAAEAAGAPWGPGSDGSSESSGSGGVDDGLDELSRRRAINKVCRDFFYRSVFIGHHVAINCLGTHRPLWGSSVATVDHHYSIAFATMVRLFDTSIVGGKALDGAPQSPDMLGDRRSLFAQARSKLADLDATSPIWPEVYAACTGQRCADPASASAALHVAADVAGARRAVEAGATLEQFVQISTAGASPSSWIPYFRVHGRRDEELRELLGGSAHLELVVWRPGLLARKDKSRLVERALGLLLTPLEVAELADVILDDAVRRAERNERSRQAPIASSGDAALLNRPAEPDVTVVSASDIESLVLARRFLTS